jgi:hypothetical protein
VRPLYTHQIFDCSNIFSPSCRSCPIEVHYKQQVPSASTYGVGVYRHGTDYRNHSYPNKASEQTLCLFSQGTACSLGPKVEKKRMHEGGRPASSDIEGLLAGHCCNNNGATREKRLRERDAEKEQCERGEREKRRGLSSRANPGWLSGPALGWAAPLPRSPALCHWPRP